jgi:hypothetical protein
VACRGEPLRVTCDDDPEAPAWAGAKEMSERTAEVAGAAARAWSAFPSWLDDWTVHYVGDPIVTCGGRSAFLGYRGCTEGTEIRVHIDGAPCPEATVLAHEIGHAIVGDAGHRDPRWCDPAFWDRMAEAVVAADPGADLECIATMRAPGWFFALNRGPCG